MNSDETQNGDFMDEQAPGTEPPQSTEPATVEIRRPVQADKPKRRPWRVVFWIMLALSIIANFFLFILLIAAAMIFSTGQKDFFRESSLRKGSFGNKIAIVRLEGIINNSVSESLREQMLMAAEDDSVKAVIIRTRTPGGTVAASDQIHHEITKFRAETEKPVVAFMQTVAASGGYYTSVACDRIIAEPTVITGSIGVMSNYLVVKELFEDKLGISSVVVKSGPKKNWPSMFEETTAEQKQYLMDKLINPAHDRFVNLVNDGRGMLSKMEVKELADGSIYGAPEALEKNLIDEIGYIDESLSSMMFSRQNKSILNMDTEALREMAVPQLMYLWDASR
ncbi:MAG: signal peptide peptidase SppA [Planctomycetota bacterium]|jgi:protease-4